MKQFILLKLNSVEVLQNDTGIISFITDNETDAMMDFTARIFTLETMINELLLDQPVIDDPEYIAYRIKPIVPAEHNPPQPQPQQKPQPS